jgi:hypothetical protein
MRRRRLCARALGPTLRPGRVVVPDDLSARRDAGVRRLVEAAGCTLAFLPPYSPDLKPIEPAWSERETLLRPAAAGGTADAFRAASAAGTDASTPADARGYFGHCGDRRSSDLTSALEGVTAFPRVPRRW